MAAAPDELDVHGEVVGGGVEDDGHGGWGGDVEFELRVGGVGGGAGVAAGGFGGPEAGGAGYVGVTVWGGGEGEGRLGVGGEGEGVFGEGEVLLRDDDGVACVGGELEFGEGLGGVDVWAAGEGVVA